MKKTFIKELTRRALCGDGLAEDDDARKKLPSTELRDGNTIGLFVPKDRHERAAVLDVLFPKVKTLNQVPKLFYLNGDLM